MTHEQNEFRQMAAAGSGMTFAFVTGAMMGAAAGLLLAPQPGRRSRQQLRDYFRKTGQKLRELSEEAEDVLEEGTEGVREGLRAAK